MSLAGEGKIVCKIDGALTHSIQVHLQKSYPDWTIERYQREFPGEPIRSKMADDFLRKKRADEVEKLKSAGTVTSQPMASIFGLPPAKATNARGQPIMVTMLPIEEVDEDARAYIPDIDPNYVFNIELTKIVLMAMQMPKTLLLWGYHGTGKTTLAEQVCARTGRPFMRVQHTQNVEESHITGQWAVKDDETVFHLGPLPVAMLGGYTYCADEYDFALPAVSAVYQSVLEGKALIIKEAPPELRVIRPHKNFRFVATGNTNGGGDESGLYQGTVMQNAANYSRFGITEEVQYPDPKVEAAIVAGQAKIKIEEAGRLVNWATEIRKAFKGGQISSVVSPRELIGAAQLAIARGGDWRGGLRLAFTNRLSRTDKELVDQFSQRIFGG